MSLCGVVLPLGASCQSAAGSLHVGRPAVRTAAALEKPALQSRNGFLHHPRRRALEQTRGRGSGCKVRDRVLRAGATGGMDSNTEDWGKLLPEKKVPLYSHSLPCIEAWLKSLDFFQSKEDRAVWLIERPDWHAQLSLDVTELYIRYLKTGPGNLERDVERKFSYALSREDIENAILGGP